MSLDQWDAVDRYFNALFVPSDPALDAALGSAGDAGMPPMQVAPNQGKLLAILAQAIGARSILEIGTFGGYSGIWLARALLPGGTLVTLELDPANAEIARANFERAGLTDRIDLHVGSALETLPKLAEEVEEGREPFDFVFIDADKANNVAYFEWALKLTRPGSLIVADNVVRDGAVVDPNSVDPSVVGVQRYSEAVAAEPRVTTTAIQWVGSKGYDGFAISLVTGS